MGSIWHDLAAAWAAWATAGESMEQAAWEQPTRLPRWDVAALYAHASAWPVMLDRLATAPDAGQTVWSDAAWLLASFNQPGGMAATAAQQVADLA